MYIYTSSQARPYVYICTHKESKQFYIGYREANVRLNRPSHIDLPMYRTSSKVVNPIFEEFSFIIFAEFFNGDDAYDFEQQLILENWNNPLILNKNFHLSTTNKRFKSKKGTKKPPMSDSHRANISKSHLGVKRGAMPYKQKKKIGDSNRGVSRSRIWTKESRKEWGDARRGENNPMFGKTHYEESREKIRQALLGKKRTEETKLKQSDAAKTRWIDKPRGEDTSDMKLNKSIAAKKRWKENPVVVTEESRLNRKIAAKRRWDRYRELQNK